MSNMNAVTTVGSKYAQRLEQLKAFQKTKTQDKTARLDRMRKRIEELRKKQQRTVAYICKDIRSNREDKVKNLQKGPSTGTSLRLKDQNNVNKVNKPDKTEHKCETLQKRKLHFSSAERDLYDGVQAKSFSMKDVKPSEYRCCIRAMEDGFPRQINLHDKFHLYLVTILMAVPCMYLQSRLQRMKLFHLTKAEKLRKESGIWKPAHDQPKFAHEHEPSTVVIQILKVFATECNEVRGEAQKCISRGLKSTSVHQKENCRTREEQLALWKHKRQQNKKLEATVKFKQNDRMQKEPIKTTASALGHGKTSHKLIKCTSSAATVELIGQRKCVTDTERIRNLSRQAITTAKPVSVVGQNCQLSAKANRSIAARKVSVSMAVSAAAQTNRVDLKANRLHSSAGLKVTSKPLHGATVEKQKFSTSSCLKVQPEMKNPLSDYGPHVSTPHSHRCVELKTPAISCIQPHRTVSVLTPALKQSTSKPVQKHTPTKSDVMSLRDKLNNWLASKGKTPSRYRHLMCFGVHGHMSSKVECKSSFSARRSRLTESKSSVDSNAHLSIDESLCLGKDMDLKAASDHMAQLISECRLLLQLGFPPSQLASWLKDLPDLLPMVVELPVYWTFRADVAMKLASDNHSAALANIDETDTNYAQRTLGSVGSQLEVEVESQLERKVVTNDTSGQPRLAAEVQQSNAFNSTAVKFCLRKIKDPVTPAQTIATPVRRSTRKSCSGLPAALRDHDVIVEMVEEVAPDIRTTMLFRDNVAMNLSWRMDEPILKPKTD